jgi:type II secretory pathway pseudopilin PulG
MKKLEAIVKDTSGFSLVEVLLAIIIITTSAVAVLMWQKTSWSQTSYTNRLMVAGHVIEKQIEERRMLIAQDPQTNFAAFKALTTLTIVDNSLNPPITVNWEMKDTLKDPAGNLMPNVRWVRIKASWGSGSKDTLQVITCIAKNF